MTLFARLLVVAAALPFVFAHNGSGSSGSSSCQPSEFYYSDKECCLPHGGVPSPPKPPSGTSCPQNWYWHSGKSCCVPSTPPTSPSPPSCSSGWSWNTSGWYCSPHTSTVHTTSPATPTPSKPGSCKNGEFYWGDKDCCLPYGGQPNPPSPPSGSSCPSNWSWHTGYGCCVPHSPPPPSPPSCSNGWGWNDSSKCCEKPKPTPTPPPHTSVQTTYHPTTTSHYSAPAPSSSDCPSNYWFWEPRSCCLPHGGQPNPPSPPSGTSCPSNWSWHTGKGCCVPHHPNQPPPQCGSGWGWDDGSKCCFPHGSSTSSIPKPSGKPGHSGGGGYWKRTHAKSRASSLCPNDLEACPIMGLNGILTGDYECADTRNDIQSCGGCASTGAGQDCTAIDGAWNVGCTNSKCVVYSCAAGYKRSADHSMCIKL
ncbi:hypothetical protein BN946_scf184911.g30 [Trametes cinnabarina]|uniref:Protein CPL1-like domain-containing protein n=1 Tax=Pycnoporus cinnabarinus TaxID=5643 RepID=A0A060SB29_PYCCI|nr:hypothetical protein BN946_scf184911.g30 [Trametes cinnabarina]